MPIDKETENKKSPPSDDVRDFHRNSDVDSGALAQHHTLGNRPNQGARGDHNHQDNNGIQLLSTPITGSRTANVASILDQICDQLELLGAPNQTTA